MDNGWLVYQCGSDWNISTTIGWISLIWYRSSLSPEDEPLKLWWSRVFIPQASQSFQPQPKDDPHWHQHEVDFQGFEYLSNILPEMYYYFFISPSCLCPRKMQIFLILVLHGQKKLRKMLQLVGDILLAGRWLVLAQPFSCRNKRWLGHKLFEARTRPCRNRTLIHIWLALSSFAPSDSVTHPDILTRTLTISLLARYMCIAAHFSM